MLTSRDIRQAGFTAIELIIAMSIGAIVLVGLGTLAVGGFANAQKTESERKAFETAGNGVSVLADDLARSKAQSRTEDVLANPAELSDALLSAQPIDRRQGGVDVTVDVADILYASGQELRIRYDRDMLRPGGLGTDGLNDCVRYYLDTSTAIPRVLREIVLYRPPNRLAPVNPAASANVPDRARGACDERVFTDRQVIVEQVN